MLRAALLLHTASVTHALTSPLLAASAAKKLRPSKDDVDRISWGKPSKKKGVGSRGVPHRLNEAERDEYDRAKGRGFVEVAGSAWRSERRDAPLLNTWRNWCDAVAMPAVSVQKGDLDLVLLDLSPLRRDDVVEVAAAVRALSVTTQCVAVAVGDGDEELVDGDAARPIHQLPRCELAWQAPSRAAAKDLAKGLVGAFGHTPKKAASRGAPQVKAGKGRRAGGYGI